uniref:DNA2/NAM7 helicase-like C-terminal domain-containing protein n=1 Tax=Ditylenchus dipsaci TaxID=166011 RepID=A0A915D3G5_9BILA
MKDEKVKIYPGGLKAVNDLENVAVPAIITKMINAKLSSKRFVCEEDQQRAQQILKVLKSTPCKLEEYVTRLKLYNHLSYAYSEIESERNISVACFLESIGEEPPIYRAKVNKAFCEKNDVKSGLRVSFHPAGWTGKVLHAKIVKVDLANGYIFAAPTDKRPRINLSQPYKVFVAPSSFNFRSRNRVLTSITAGNQQNIVFPQLPKDMMPVIDYVQQEAEDLAQMRFSPEKHLNQLQKVAIIGIMRASPSLPYLLFGPPGTGKTTTLVETIVQLLNASSANKVLVCTPSNTAADLFALALLKTGVVADTSILRMFSVSKPVNEQNVDLDDVTWVVDDSDGFQFLASSYLVSGGLKGTFSHIIVDEAGQADELDTLIPIAGLADENTRVVLAGDPNQLGPVESIELLKPFELNTSLLERFIKSSCYGCDRLPHFAEKKRKPRFGKTRFVAKQMLTKKVMTMLKNNYRSHALLVETPSKLFYNGLLIASAMQSQKSTICEWSGLPTKSVPLILHSISDVEEVEKDGFSCRNLKEAELVVNYYQVKTLREQLSSLPEMDIDSVERFQGSERRVIIISTVRNMGLGFWIATSD